MPFACVNLPTPFRRQHRRIDEAHLIAQDRAQQALEDADRHRFYQAVHILADDFDGDAPQGTPRQDMMQRPDALRQLHIGTNLVIFDAGQQRHIYHIAIIAIAERVDNLLDNLYRQILPRLQSYCRRYVAYG